MGRKRILTDEERLARRVASQAKYAQRNKTLVVDAILIERLQKSADELVAVFGFRPTLSQTLRYLLRQRAPHLVKPEKS